MKNLIITLLVIFSFESYGQLSEFYMSNGKLKIDSTYQIYDPENMPEFTRFSGVKNDLTYTLIQHVNYPPNWMDNGTSGVVIIELSLRKSDNQKLSYNLAEVVNITCVKNLIENDTNILSDLNYLKSCFFIFPNSYEIPDNYKIYIPILFKISLADEHKIIKYYHNNIVTIEGNIIPVINNSH